MHAMTGAGPAVLNMQAFHPNGLDLGHWFHSGQSEMINPCLLTKRASKPPNPPKCTGRQVGRRVGRKMYGRDEGLKAPTLIQ